MNALKIMALKFKMPFPAGNVAAAFSETPEGVHEEAQFPEGREEELVALR